MVEARRSEEEFSPSGWLVGALDRAVALAVAAVRTFLLGSRGPLVLVVLFLAAGLAILGGVLLLERRER